MLALNVKMGVVVFWRSVVKTLNTRNIIIKFCALKVFFCRPSKGPRDLIAFVHGFVERDLIAIVHVLVERDFDRDRSRCN